MNHMQSIRKTGVRSSLKRQAGFDLVQISVAVAIIAFIMAIAFLAVPTVMTNIKVNAETGDLQQMVSNAGRVAGTGADLSGLNAAAAINLRLAPPDRVFGGNINNRFGGTVAWALSNLFGSNDGISITSRGYGPEACSKLIPNVQTMFTRITVGSTVVKNLAAATPVPLSATGMANACAAANSQDIVFEFTR
ncbi:hypothetical protein DK842_22780 (plasmid) [Chromobacterium phragmitis]|uniref:Type 4 pilus major pilin n=1 Tax=Chromobacterium phragmitis TaxID=2202141 RepID=A0ABV0J0E0_9NEIS|nr:type 4 pilus major pilin [Chromobacterium phragmitis]AXE28455.1 hypothetical protein DK842_00015 [Chromobacterium phragmitis]AXE32820.1 hypothetical protein DK842_22780 [Chromobacterium phragmitis]